MHAFFNAVRRSSICADISQFVDYSCNELCVLYQAELRRILDDFAPPTHITTIKRPASSRLMVSVLHRAGMLAH